MRETPRSAYAFVNSIGINTHINYFDRTYGNFSLVERELKSIGILHLRDGLHLRDPAFNQMVYGRWIQLGKIGIRFDAVADPRSNLGIINPAMLSRVSALAGQTIESFEGPNELDISKFDDWPTVDRDFQRTLFTAAKAVNSDPPIDVIGPSLAFARHGSHVGDMSDRVDALNLHPYPAAQVPSVVFPEQTDFAKAMSNNKPIVFTETGYHNALNDHHDQPAVSETTAAKYIPRLFLEDFARGVSRTYLYELLDEAPDPSLSDNQLHWGLVRADGSEKPAFSATRNLIAELRDAAAPERLIPLAWAISSSNPQIHHLLLQKANGEYDLILWQEVSSYDYKTQTDIKTPDLTAVLLLGTPAQKVMIYKPASQSEPLRAYSHVSRMPLEIPDSPLVIAITVQ